MHSKNDLRLTDAQRADLIEQWWTKLEPEQRKGYLANIERHLEQSYPKRREAQR